MKEWASFAESTRLFLLGINGVIRKKKRNIPVPLLTQNWSNIPDRRMPMLLLSYSQQEQAEARQSTLLSCRRPALPPSR